MENYLEDVNKMDRYIEEKFNRKSIQNENIKTQEELRNMNSRYWGAREALLRCSENVLKDPLDILDEFEQELENKSLWDSKQKINKEHYNNAARAVHEIWEYLSQERKI